MKTILALALLEVVACSAPDGPGSPSPDATQAEADAAAVVPRTLEVQSLGVSGVLLRYGEDAVMTAPLFTRQTTIEVALGVPLAADTAAIDAGLATAQLGALRAVVSGHAHYDHFMDVPRVLELAPTARAYTNLTGRHMLAALAPDRPSCTTPGSSTTIARDRVVAMDDAAASYVDYTNCPGQRPLGVPLVGNWLHVPGSNVRIKAFCSMHPDQIGPIHFGAGHVDRDRCDLPASANEWLEGQTLAFLVDFLDGDGNPIFRVFYQDAPTDAPIGEVPAATLADKRVDLALLCVGSTNAVDNQPAAAIANLAPRFALSHHWEDFFNAPHDPPDPLPFLDLAAYKQDADTAMAGPGDAPLVVNGEEHAGRHVVAMPGMTLVVPGAP